MKKILTITFLLFFHLFADEVTEFETSERSELINQIICQNMFSDKTLEACLEFQMLYPENREHNDENRKIINACFDEAQLILKDRDSYIYTRIEKAFDEFSIEELKTIIECGVQLDSWFCSFFKAYFVYVMNLEKEKSLDELNTFSFQKLSIDNSPVIATITSSELSQRVLDAEQPIILFVVKDVNQIIEYKSIMSDISGKYINEIECYIYEDKCTETDCIECYYIDTTKNEKVATVVGTMTDNVEKIIEEIEKVISVT